MMKQFLVLLTAAVISVGPATAAQEQDVMAAMNAWIQATTSQDIPALGKILHDDLIYTHSTGKKQTKSEVIEDVKNNMGPIGIELSETAVHLYGDDTALVTAMVRVRNRPRDRGANAPPPPAPGAGAARGNAQARGLFITHLLVKGPSGWQLVTRQAIRLAE